MARFLAIRSQDEGCDDTIGCGYSYEIVEADDMAGAFEALKKKVFWGEYEDFEYYNPKDLISGESQESVTIYEIGVDDGGKTYDTWLADLARRYAAHKAKAAEDKDHAEFERLRKKLGK